MTIKDIAIQIVTTGTLSALAIGAFLLHLPLYGWLFIVLVVLDLVLTLYRYRKTRSSL